MGRRSGKIVIQSIFINTKTTNQMENQSQGEEPKPQVTKEQLIERCTKAINEANDVEGVVLFVCCEKGVMVDIKGEFSAAHVDVMGDQIDEQKRKLLQKMFEVALGQ